MILSLLVRLFKLLVILMLLTGTWITYQYAIRPGMGDYKHHLPPLSSGPLTLRWLGTAAVLVDDGETQILIDPYFSRPSLFHMLTHRLSPDARWVKEGMLQTSIRSPAAVLVSHSHFDHALDAPLIAKETGADIIGSASTANIARGQEVEERHIKTVVPDKPLTYGKFTIRFIPSAHGGWFKEGKTIDKPLPSPAWAWQYRMGDVYSILIEHPEGTILHHASAGIIPENLAPYRADVVLLGIALRPDTEHYVGQVVNTVHAKTVMPIHWDDFSRSLSQPLTPLPGVALDSFFRDMKRYHPEIKVETLPFNKAVGVQRAIGRVNIEQ